jgi:hypothetical protein
MVLDRLGEVEGNQDACFANLQLAEHAHPTNSLDSPEGKNILAEARIQSTTGMVAIQYTTDLVGIANAGFEIL